MYKPGLENGRIGAADGGERGVGLLVVPEVGHRERRRWGGSAEEEVEEEEEEDAAAKDGEAEGAFAEAFEDGLVGGGVVEGVAAVGPDAVRAPDQEKNQVDDGEPAGAVVLAAESLDDHENNDRDIKGRGDEAGAKLHPGEFFLFLHGITKLCK